MFVPFRIKGIPYDFTVQLDIGAPSTMVYGNAFKPLLEMFPELNKKLDTVNKSYVIQGKPFGGLKNITFCLDTVCFDNRNVAYFEGFGEKLSNNDFKADTPVHIGTLGADLFSEKILIIDFKNKRFAVADSVNKNTAEKLTSIIIEKGRIKVPIIIDGKKVYVLYDTGSSFASLYLSTNNWDNYRDTLSAIDTMYATAWGIKYHLFISKTDIKIKIGDKIFKPETIMANNLKSYYDFYNREKITGLMGNKLFYDKVVIIDFKNKKFGIVDNADAIIP